MDISTDITNLDKMPSKFKTIIPKDTVLIRVGNSSNNLSPFRYFAYWQGNFIENYKKYKETWESRCGNTASVEIWKFKKDAQLINFSYYSLTFDDPSEDDKEQVKIFHEIIDSQLKELSTDRKKCYKRAINQIYGIPDSINIDPSICSKINRNDDIVASYMFVDYNLHGWVRFAGPGNESLTEIFLTNDAVKNYLEAVETFSCDNLLSPTFLPRIPREFMQPLTTSVNKSGGYSQDVMYLKYKKYKTKYMILKRNMHII